VSVNNDLIGAKGGGGTFRNRPDNLRSTDTFEALIGLCTGRIRGLAPGGLKNLKVDDVPIEDGSGNTTLKDFNAIMFNGDPAVLQPVTLQLGGSSGASTVNLPINNPNQGTGTANPGDWRYGTVRQAGVDYIDIRLVVNGLFRQDKKGIYDATATLEVELQPSGSDQWVNPMGNMTAPKYNPNGIKLNSLAGVLLYGLASNWADSTTWADPTPGFLSITGKTSQPYVKELRVAVPNAGAYANKTWQVRIRLRERDSYTNDQDQESRAIVWESVAGVSMAPIGDREEWRGLAYLQINGKASDQLTGIPTITGVFDLSEIRVPPASVWDSEARTYSGNTWDGATEEIKWTQCPAFQMKDLIEDELSGISALVPGSTMNKWDALDASKWYAQRVPDGKGGTHPRYTMNYLLDSAMSVNDLMQYTAGAVGSYAWDEGDGNWRLVVEKPENATALFTKESIVGEFSYSHTDIDTRLNDMIGVFRNEERNYEEDRVRVFDQPHIDNYGRRAASIALVGCTNRQEALRRVKIRQLTSLNETRQVSFVTNRQGNLVQPFSVILVADGDLASDTSTRTTGRLVGRSGTTLTVRDSMRLEVGVAYKVHVTVPNPAYNPNTATQPGSPEWRKPTITISRTITNTAGQRGDVKSLLIDSELPADTPVNAQIALEAVGLPTLPIQYRVLDVEPNDDEELVTITAIEIYTKKWDESDNVNEDDILAQRPNKIILPPLVPESGMFSVRTYQAEFQTKRVFTVNWVRPGSIWIDGFKVEYNLNSGPWVTLTEKTQDSYVELQQPQNGVYTFRITTIDRRGGVSQPLIGTYELSDTAEDYAPVHTRGKLMDRPVTGSREGDKYTTTDQNPNMTYIWSKGQWYDESNFVTEAGQIKYGNGDTVEDLMPAEPGATDGGTIGNNIKNPDGTIYVPPTPEQLVDTQGPGLVTNLNVTTNLDDYGSTILASWTGPSDSDLAGYDFAIREGTGQYFDYPTTTANYKIAALPRGREFRIKVRAYDRLGNRGVYTAEKIVTTAKDSVAPPAPTGLAVSAAFETFFLTWNNPTDNDLDVMEIWAGATNDATKAVLIATQKVTPAAKGTYTRGSMPRGTTQWHFLRAVDTSGNKSPFSAGVSATTTTVDIGDLTPGLNLVKDVSVLPSATGYTGPKIVWHTGERRFYRYQDGKWVGNVVDVDDLEGKLSGSQIEENTISGENLVPETITSDLFEKNVRIPGNIVDINDKLIFGLDGFITPDATTLVNGNTIKLSTIAQNSLVPSLNYVGEFPSPPSQAQLGDKWKQNAVYKNSTDTRSYVLTGSPLDWVVYLSDGLTFNVEIESSNGTVFRVGQHKTTVLKARLFKNGAEVTDSASENWFRWRRISVVPREAPNDDATWNEKYKTGYKQISIDIDAVQSQATFFVDIIN